jgi:hypothetical protein
MARKHVVPAPAANSRLASSLTSTSATPQTTPMIVLGLVIVPCEPASDIP